HADSQIRVPIGAEQFIVKAFWHPLPPCKRNFDHELPIHQKRKSGFILTNAPRSRQWARRASDRPAVRIFMKIAERTGFFGIDGRCRKGGRLPPKDHRPVLSAREPDLRASRCEKRIPIALAFIVNLRKNWFGRE